LAVEVGVAVVEVVAVSAGVEGAGFCPAATAINTATSRIPPAMAGIRYCSGMEGIDGHIIAEMPTVC
jgi:hypothetical protein